MTKITLLSLNTFGGGFDFIKRFPALSSHLNTSEADILQFQEVYSYLHLESLKRNLKSYPYLAYQKSLFKPRGGLVIFSRQPLANISFINYSRKYVPYLGRSIVELLTDRGVLKATIKGESIDLINTHLTAVLNANWSKESIYYKELHSEISQFHNFLDSNDNKKVTIISGDFNIAKGTDLYRELVNTNQLFDPFKDDLSPTRHSQYVAPGRKPNRVDYLFIVGNRAHYKMLGSKNVLTEKVSFGFNKFDYLSDHMGLQTTVEIST